MTEGLGKSSQTKLNSIVRLDHNKCYEFDPYWVHYICCEKQDRFVDNYKGRLGSLALIRYQFRREKTL